LDNQPIFTKLNFKVHFSWCLYDWATSAFFSVITTFVFAAYFTSKIAPSAIDGTFWWGNAMGLAALIVALVSPILGSIADYGGHRRVWLFCFTLLGTIACFLLWFAYPEATYMLPTLLLIVLSTVALETGFTFYNALLIHIAPKRYLGRLSGWAWGLGYLGGLTCLIISLLVFVYGNIFNLDEASSGNIRIIGPLIGAWITLFSLPLFIWVKDLPSQGYSSKQAISLGLTKLKQNLKRFPQQKNLLFFFL
jgi:UMF1 family MFS transporter